MKVLVIDVGGTHVKIASTAVPERLSFSSGAELTAESMVVQAKKMVESWDYEAISIGYPGVVLRGRIAVEPRNLGRGWVGFDFETAFGRPVKIVNDAAMQALGSYRGKGTMLFLGLGTGLGAALVTDGSLVPLELARLPYLDGELEDYVGERALRRMGKARWRDTVDEVVRAVAAAFVVDEVVLGGGNARKLKELPPRTRLGSNALAMVGGERLWQEPARRGRTRFAASGQG